MKMGGDEYLLKHLANEMAKMPYAFIGWKTVIIKLDEDVFAEVRAGFSDYALFTIDYITIVIRPFPNGKNQSYTICREQINHIEFEANESYLIIRKSEQ